MRKLLLLTGCALAVTTVATAASAEEMLALRPYVGLDYNFNDVNVDSGSGIPDSYSSLNPYLGLEFNKYIALEGGYFQSAEESENVSIPLLGTGETNLKLKGWYADVIGSLPINPQVDILGLVGYGQAKFTGDIDIAGTSVNVDSDNVDMWRFGGGASYNITDNVRVRGLVRYITLDEDSGLDDAFQYSAGVNYRF